MPDDLKTRVINDFKFHAATEKTGPLHDTARAILKAAALDLVDICPPSRELSLSLTALEEAMHWANAAIAKHLSE